VKKISEINFQNFPKHENKEVRNIITCPEGHIIVSFDYAQLEARILAMASKDKVFCKAIWDNSDTHMKWTNNLIKLYPQILSILDNNRGLDEAKLKKELRSDIKNHLVFAGFYGSGKSTITNYYNQTYGIPTHIMEKIYNDFWDTYKDVKKWQKETVAFYNKNGYVESLTHRRRRAPLTYNEVINFPIQSSASYDVCIVAGDRLSELAWKLNKLQYQYIICIHDDLTFYLPIDTLEEDITFIGKEMVNPVYKWINIPLEVEYSMGKNWGIMEEAGKISTTMFWKYENNEWVLK
jgi:DNA polymerase-1